VFGPSGVRHIASVFLLVTYCLHCWTMAKPGKLCSVPHLAWGLTVWFWSTVAAKVQTAHDADFSVYSFGVGHEVGSEQSNAEYKAMLMVLPTVAGLSGGSMRIPNSVFGEFFGERSVVPLATFLLAASLVVGGVGLSQSNCPFSHLVISAAFSGTGVNALASCMSEISFDIPKAQERFSLSVNAGIRNIGMSVMQLALPFVMLFAALGTHTRDLSDTCMHRLWVPRDPSPSAEFHERYEGLYGRPPTPPESNAKELLGKTF